MDKHLFMAIHLEILLEIYTSEFSHCFSNKTWILLCPRALFLLGGHVCKLPLSVRIIPFIWVDLEVSNCRTSGLGMRPDETFHLDPDTDTEIHNSLDQSDTHFFWSYEVMKSAVVTSPMNPISNHICSWAAMWEERELGPVVPRNGTNNTTVETTRGCDSVTNVRHCHSCWKCTFHHIICVYIYIYWRYMYDFANHRSLLAEYLTSSVFTSMLPSVWNEGLFSGDISLNWARCFHPFTER